jgi:hypothetical protein
MHQSNADEWQLARAAQTRLHVRDVSRPAHGLQVCSCGHITRTVEEMKAHVAEENGVPARSRPNIRFPEGHS